MEKEYRLLNPSNQILMTLKLDGAGNCASVECFKKDADSVSKIEPPWGKALVFFDIDGNGEVLTVKFPTKEDASKKAPGVKISKLPTNLAGSSISSLPNTTMTQLPWEKSGAVPSEEEVENFFEGKKRTLVDLHSDLSLSLVADGNGSYFGVEAEDDTNLPWGKTSYALDFDAEGRVVYTIAFPADQDVSKIRLGKKDLPDDEALIKAHIAAPVAEPVAAKNAASVYSLPAGVSLALKVTKGNRAIQIGDMEHNLIISLTLSESNQCIGFNAMPFSMPGHVGIGMRSEPTLPFGQTRLFNTNSGELILVEFPKPRPGGELSDYKPIVRGIWPEGHILEAVSFLRQTEEEAAAELLEDGEEILPVDPSKREVPDGAFVNAVLKYTVNLTELAEKGQLEPFVDRAGLLEKAEKTLLQRKRMNVALVGPPGVGKSAITEGLARRFATGEGHEGVGDVVFLKVNVGKILKDVMPPMATPTSLLYPLFEGLSERAGIYHDQDGKKKKVVLVLDEITDLLENQHYDNLGNFLKPYLTSRRIRCIPATTDEQYKKFIASDKALDSRFNKITVPSPKREEVLDILRNKRPLYEKKHGIKISDEMLELIYDTGSYQLRILNEPRRSESVLDGAAAEAQHKRDKELLPKHIFSEIAELANLDPVFVGRSLKERIDELAKIKQEDLFGQDKAVDQIVDKVQAHMTGLTDPDKPLGSFVLLGPPGTGKTEMAYKLAARLFGAKTGDDSDDRDVERSKVVKLDMSKFNDEYKASGMFGTTAGYVGFNESGAAELLDGVMKNPDCVVLLDEIEKAHPAIFQSLLPIFDKGEIKDYHGNTVSFKNTVILMAGNLGSAAAEVAGQKGSILGQSGAAKGEDVIMGEYKKRTSPEFRDRIDNVVIFDKHTPENAMRILVSKIKKVGAQLRHNTRGLKVKDVAFEVSEDVRKAIVGKYFDPKVGSARAIAKEAIDTEIAAPLGRWLVGYDGAPIAPGSTLRMTGLGKEFNIQVIPPAATPPANDAVAPRSKPAAKAARP